MHPRGQIQNKMASSCRTLVRCFFHILRPYPLRRYCLPATVTSNSFPPLKTIQELKEIDPKTGEKRIGNNFVYEMELSALANRLGFTISQLPSLQQALIHKSALSSEEEEGHNLQLASVGKEVLTTYVHGYIDNAYPNLEHSHVQDITRYLTDEPALVKVADYMGISNLILTREDYNESTVGKCLKAVFGAVHADRGKIASDSVIQRLIIPQLKDADLKDLITIDDPIRTLHKMLRRQGRFRPVPRILKETGRLTHFPTFVVGIYSGRELIGEGTGSSIKRAKAEAAATALRYHYMKEIKGGRKRRKELE